MNLRGAYAFIACMVFAGGYVTSCTSDWIRAHGAKVVGFEPEEWPE